uniref:hypothetical protein n=1 Tax=Wolbachia endosymbiont of Wuchereria bancrofti TaxID=96496 RepID=UPI0011805AB9|nr:hypothetical protein [Wolbachia endosymbiont of Wuchereria bancrofti]
MLEVKYLGKDGKVKINCSNEHAYNPHADDILASVTKAFEKLEKDGMCYIKWKMIIINQYL